MQRRYVLAQERREEKQREWLKRHLQFQLELSERQLRAQQERDESFRARTEKRREESKRQYEKWRDGYASSRQLGKPSSTLQPSSIIRSKPTLYDERGAGGLKIYRLELTAITIAMFADRCTERQDGQIRGERCYRENGTNRARSVCHQHSNGCCAIGTGSIGGAICCRVRP